METLPEAKSIRSHSMTQNTKLLELFLEAGFTHDVNHFIPHQSKINLKPWRLWNGLIKVPYFWEDDIACLYDDFEALSNLGNYNGLKVFDFHPIHIFLNSESMGRYEETRAFHKKPEILSGFKNVENFGSRDALELVLSWARCG